MAKMKKRFNIPVVSVTSSSEKCTTRADTRDKAGCFILKSVRILRLAGELRVQGKKQFFLDLDNRSILLFLYGSL